MLSESWKCINIFFPVQNTTFKLAIEWKTDFNPAQNKLENCHTVPHKQSSTVSRSESRPHRTFPNCHRSLPLFTLFFWANVMMLLWRRGEGKGKEEELGGQTVCDTAGERWPTMSRREEKHWKKARATKQGNTLKVFYSQVNCPGKLLRLLVKCFI